MAIFMEFTVSDAQLRALQSADKTAGPDRGYIRAGNGIRWTTLVVMARADRAWVTLDAENRRARITRRGVAMITVGQDERRRAAARTARSALAGQRLRSFDPFALIASTHTRPAHRL